MVSWRLSVKYMYQFWIRLLASDFGFALSIDKPVDSEVVGISRGVSDLEKGCSGSFAAAQDDIASLAAASSLPFDSLEDFLSGESAAPLMNNDLGGVSSSSQLELDSASFASTVCGGCMGLWIWRWGC